MEFYNTDTAKMKYQRCLVSHSEFPDILFYIDECTSGGDAVLIPVLSANDMDPISISIESDLLTPIRIPDGYINTTRGKTFYKNQSSRSYKAMTELSSIPKVNSMELVNRFREKFPTMKQAYERDKAFSINFAFTDGKLFYNQLLVGYVSPDKKNLLIGDKQICKLLQTFTDKSLNVVFSD